MNETININNSRSAVRFMCATAPPHIGKTSLYFATRPLLTQHDRTAIIKGYEFFPISIPTTAIAFCAAVADIVCSLSGRALGQLIAGGAGARPDHPINGRVRPL